MTTPEQEARKQIDELLGQAGWQIQDFRFINLSASLGIDVRVVSAQGPALFISV